jgi:N-acetylglucosamine kinase-like BadF-type ATPase
LERAIEEIAVAAKQALGGPSLILPVNGEGLGGVNASCLCLAGHDRPLDEANLRPAIEALGLHPPVILKNDSFAALRAGTRNGCGVVVIMGAGFNAAGRAPDGREIQFPSQGAISGDWGGGNDVGMAMLGLVMRAWDGRERPTKLTPLMLEAMNASSVEELLWGLVDGAFDPWKLTNLAPLVFEVANEGDEVAQGLVMRIGTEAGVAANAIIKRLGLEDEAVEVALGGGLFKGKGPLLIDTMTQVVHRVAPRALLRRLPWEPVVGAAFLALEAAGVVVTDEVRRHIAATLPPEWRRPEIELTLWPA